MSLHHLSFSAQQLMAAAATASKERGHYFLGVEHLFATMALSDKTPLHRALVAQKLDVPRFCSEMNGAIAEYERPPWGSELLYSPRCREVLRIAGWFITNAYFKKVLVDCLIPAWPLFPLQRVQDVENTSHTA